MDFLTVIMASGIARGRVGEAATVLRKMAAILQPIAIGYYILYNNQINARALIGQSAVVYCAGKPTEKSRVF